MLNQTWGWIINYWRPLVAGLAILATIVFFYPRFRRFFEGSRRRAQPIPVASPPPPPHASPQGFLQNIWGTWMERVLVYIFAAYTFITIFAWIMTEKGGIMWWAVALVMCACHFIGSIKIINEQEVGVRVLFGVILNGQLDSGPYFVPWPMRLRKGTKNSVQVDFGTLDQSQMDRAAQSEESPSWYLMTEPIRINWGDINSDPDTTPEEKEAYKHDPYAQRLTTDPHLYFRFKVYNLVNLIRTVGDIEEAIERIKDTCVTALSERAGKTFVARAVQEIDILSQEIFNRVQELVIDPQSEAFRRNPQESWGIDIEDVRVKDLGTPRRTNIAVAERSKAVAEADGRATATRLDAAAERDKLIQEAEGRAQAKEREALAEKKRLTEVGEGQAAALKARAEVVDSPGGKMILQAETLQRGLEAGRTVVLPANFGSLTDILTAVTAAKEVTEKNPPSAPPQPPRQP